MLYVHDNIDSNNTFKINALSFSFRKLFKQ